VVVFIELMGATVTEEAMFCSQFDKGYGCFISSKALLFIAMVSILIKIN
jgi:hypothetical protein